MEETISQTEAREHLQQAGALIEAADRMKLRARSSHSNRTLMKRGEELAIRLADERIALALQKADAGTPAREVEADADADADAETETEKPAATTTQQKQRGKKSVDDTSSAK